MTPQNIGPAAENAVREIAPWIEKLARLGFLAKAVLYVTIGALATAAALRLGGTPGTGSRGAMAKLINAPFGELLIAVIAVGLFGYAAWRLVEGIVDPEGNGRDTKGIAKRARSLGIGILHAALAISALKLVSGDVSAGADGGMSQDWTAFALNTPGGVIALWIIAAGFVVYGAYQLYKAWKSQLNKRLALGRMAPQTQRWVIAASRFGIAARGVVFMTIGGLLVRAVRQSDPREARGIKTALLELFELGRWPFLLVATGLIAYGVYEFINARYRRIAVA